MSGFNYADIHSNSKRHNAVPPPSSGLSKQGYSTMNAISQNALSAAWGGTSRKRAATEDEYFEEDDEEAIPDLAYIPAPDSPTRIDMEKKKREEEEDDDPLDAYMAGIEKQMQVQNKKTSISQQTGVRNDLEEEDIEESYYRYMEENPNAGVGPVDDEYSEIEYDEDGNPIAPDKKRIIDPLPPIDHSEIDYKPFTKVFYEEHSDIKALSDSQVSELRKTLDITVSGKLPPKPVSSFPYFGFDDRLLKAIIKAGYSTPTPIQAQAVPCALHGRDVLGIAQTDKITEVAKLQHFLWPLLKHVATQKPVEEGEGPSALILAPTRELAIQIYNEARKFAKVYDLKLICAYGGGSKWEQSLALKEGADIVVATPGRIIDHIKSGSTNLQRVTFLVLDEADRMFELGFEPQGITGQANEDVTQYVLLMPNQESKREWLYRKLVEFLSAGSVLVFVTKKVDAEQVFNDLKLKEFDCLLLHGDMEQVERNKVIMAYKKKECSLLVATDVAARGLDIPHVRTVVNFDLARDIDMHTHRIGRTGRAGTQGTAYTLLTPKDKEFAGHIVKNLEAAHQEVPQEVLELALQSSWFRKQRCKKKDYNPNVGGMGLGFKEKVSVVSQNVMTSSSNTNPSVSRGPATDRLSAMKAAFRAQYQNQ
ncbi:hypothetical protein NQ318_007688, partial [Aromia moschata]